MTFTLKNTGSVAGADAVQVYVGPPSDSPAGIQFAVRSLAQFDRVDLEPGQSKDVTLHIPARQLSYWSEAKQQWVLDSGGRALSVGDADAPASLPLHATLLGANGNVTCSNGQLNATTISGNLSVPRGSWCDLVDVTVNGNVQVQNGSGVRLAGSTINGNLQLQNTTGAADAMSSGANVDLQHEGHRQRADPGKRLRLAVASRRLRPEHDRREPAVPEQRWEPATRSRTRRSRGTCSARATTTSAGAATRSPATASARVSRRA